MVRHSLCGIIAACLVATPALADGVGAVVNGSALTVSISPDRFAGAISSLTYRGVEYVDTADHGREIQSAIQLDGLGECDNPNEAGSRADGRSLTSSSILNVYTTSNNVLHTETRPAYWLSPYSSYGRPCNPNLPYPRNQISNAQNTTVLSNYTISRTTSFYGPSIPNLLNVDVSFTIPENRASSNAEALTGYLPASFNVFLQYDRASRTLTRVAVSDTDTASQHTSLPVIVAQANGANAMGVMSPGIMTNPGRGYIAYILYGGSEPTAKWSCVYGETNLTAGSVYSYSCPIAVGNVDEVVSAMTAYPVPGQAVSTMVPVYRFIKQGHHFLTPSYSEGAGASFVFENTAFHLYPAAAAGLIPLYRCNRTAYVDHFASSQPNCEGASQEGVYGYASSGPGAGLVPLYRFYKNSLTDHLITVNYSEGANNGYSYDGILGYVAY
jgi:hypothetical protein